MALCGRAGGAKAYDYHQSSVLSFAIQLLKTQTRKEPLGEPIPSPLEMYLCFWGKRRFLLPFLTFPHSRQSTTTVKQPDLEAYELHAARIRRVYGYIGEIKMLATSKALAGETPAMPHVVIPMLGNPWISRFFSFFSCAPVVFRRTGQSTEYGGIAANHHLAGHQLVTLPGQLLGERIFRLESDNEEKRRRPCVRLVGDG